MYTKTTESADTRENTKNVPPTVMARDTERKDMATIPLQTLFPTAPSADACALSRNGKISDVKTQQTGPIPIEKKATFPQTKRSAKAIPSVPWPRNVRVKLRLKRQRVIPTVLT